MPPHKPEKQGHQIVLIGDFNPKIFQPAWFGAEGLIQPSEVESARIEIIHPEVVIFLLGWLRLEVTRERFSAGTQQEPYHEVIRDLVVGTFRLLRHTPVKLMGINWEAHFRVESEEKWHAIGHTLAPPQMWEEVLIKPGMGSLTITGVRPDSLNGKINVTVEPSAPFHPGIFVRINDHFESGSPASALGADEIIGVLEDNWAESYKRSTNIFKKVLESVK
jgi:hypothetical protein